MIEFIIILGKILIGIWSLWAGVDGLEKGETQFDPVLKTSNTFKGKPALILAIFYIATGCFLTISVIKDILRFLQK